MKYQISLQSAYLDMFTRSTKIIIYMEHRSALKVSFQLVHSVTDLYKRIKLNMCVYIQIYIYREREIHKFIYKYTHTYIQARCELTLRSRCTWLCKCQILVPSIIFEYQCFTLNFDANLLHHSNMVSAERFLLWI